MNKILQDLLQIAEWVENLTGDVQAILKATRLPHLLFYFAAPATKFLKLYINNANMLRCDVA